MTAARAHAAAHAAAQPLLEARGLTRRFAAPDGGVLLACDGVDMDLHAGRIHALLGENGAGKSTLMSMLSGWMEPDEGLLRLSGRAVRLASPAAAMRAGIGMVHQRFSLVEALTGAENLALALGGAPNARKARELAEGYGLAVDPARRVNAMSMGERQRLEILKLLAREARILILDEPTSVLAPAEIDGLLSTLRTLADQGRAVVLITHKLAEVAHAADEVSVLRRGRMEARNLHRDAHGGFDMAGLSRLMVGRDLSEDADGAPDGPAERTGESGDGPPALSVQSLCGPGQPPAFADVSFEVRTGEVFAVVGVAGNGQESLAAVLGGMEKPSAGRMRVLGRGWRRSRVAYVPEDRDGAATVPGLTLAENMLLSTSGMRGLYFWRGAGARAARAAIEALGVRAGGPQSLARELSGGNLQKFIMARELSKGAPVLIVEQPTQGLDVLAVAEVREAIRRAARQAAVVLVTGDPAEALALAGRVAVIYRGRVAGVVPSAEAGALDRIGRLMAGLDAQAGEAAA